MWYVFVPTPYIALARLLWRRLIGEYVWCFHFYIADIRERILDGFEGTFEKILSEEVCRHDMFCMFSYRSFRDLLWIEE